MVIRASVCRRVEEACGQTEVEKHKYIPHTSLYAKHTNRNKTQKATELGWSSAGMKPWIQFPAICKLGDT